MAMVPPGDQFTGELSPRWKPLQKLTISFCGEKAKILL